MVGQQEPASALEGDAAAEGGRSHGRVLCCQEVWGRRAAGTRSWELVRVHGTRGGGWVVSAGFPQTEPTVPFGEAKSAGDPFIFRPRFSDCGKNQRNTQKPASGALPCSPG